MVIAQSKAQLDLETQMLADLFTNTAHYEHNQLIEVVKDFYGQKSSEYTQLRDKSFVVSCKRAVYFVLNKNDLKPQ